MTIKEKLDSAKELNERLERVEYQLSVITVSRKKADKNLARDSFPTRLKLMAWQCTGTDGGYRGDTYEAGIVEPTLLRTLFNVIEPVLLSEKRALEAELNQLLGTEETIRGLPQE